MKKTQLRNEKGQFKKATKISEYGVVNLSTYTSPEIKEVSGKNWIEYGADNNYFQYLIDRYNGSPTNNAAINGISQAIYGKGINATDSNRKPNEYAQMISLFKKEVVRKLCYDLKLMGQCAVQVIYSKDRKKIAQLEHFPIETLRAERCNEDGEIPAYYYFKDWANIKRSDTPKRIPAYGMSNENIEIYYIKPYKSGFYYYSPVDYQGGLQYAELEEEVSNFHLNNILNGLAPSMLINFNNGTPNQQERQLIEQKIAAKYQGSSNAGRFIIAFNDSKDAAADITPIQLSDAHNQYEFLSSESTSKIMVAHRIVSPMLLGIKDGSGLGNNAEEIKTASLLMDNTVIRPFQELLIDCFDQLLAYNDIALNLYFTTLQPLEFTEVNKDLQDNEDIEEETGYEFSKDENLKMIDGKQAYKTKEEAEAKAKEMGCGGSHEHEVEGVVYFMPCVSHEELKSPCWDGHEQYGTKMVNGKKVPNCVPLSEMNLADEIGAELAQELLELGQDEDDLLDDYELVDVSEVDYDNEEKNDKIIQELNQEQDSKQSTLSKIVNLISTGRAYPKSKSKQDGNTKQSGRERFMVRYQYAPLKASVSNSRKFCVAMVNAKKIYRKEDIEKLSSKPVNAGFGIGGSATYSIWLNKIIDKNVKNSESDSYKLYKGGARCKHKWFRKTYMLTLDGDKSLVSTTKAKSKGFKFPVNDQLVPVAPHDMNYRGYTKSYWDKMGFKY